MVTLKLFVFFYNDKMKVLIDFDFFVFFAQNNVCPLKRCTLLLWTLAKRVLVLGSQCHVIIVLEIFLTLFPGKNL